MSRRHDYAVGLSAEALARYDAPDRRSNYHQLQAVLANMELRERSELGRSFDEAIRRRRESGSAFSHRAMHLDSRPEWVYVVGSSAGILPADLEAIKMNLMVAALAYFRKTHCLLIIDRENASYEAWLMIKSSVPSSPHESALGEKLFAHLRMSDAELALIPTG